MKPRLPRYDRYGSMKEINRAGEIVFSFAFRSISALRASESFAPESLGGEYPDTRCGFRDLPMVGTRLWTFRIGPAARCRNGTRSADRVERERHEPLPVVVPHEDHHLTIADRTLVLFRQGPLRPLV